MIWCENWIEIGVKEQSAHNSYWQLLKLLEKATRLRILALLETGELNVTDLTQILEQSQPRISRHLRLLAEAGLIERFREGSFVYCRLAKNKLRW